MSNNSIAVGVPMFSREAALAQFLESVPAYVETAYVADNGEAGDRELYQRDWPFELVVEQMPYDCGIGQCRARIAQLCSEDYLWAGDNDMEFVDDDDLRRMRDLLEAEPQLGGVSGWLIEHDSIRSGARNIVEHGNKIIKTVPETPTVKRGGPLPYAKFDFIPQAGLFRADVLEDYRWDPEMFNSEHLDFFLGHRAQTDWEWASTPAVVIEHHRNIDEHYRETKRGYNHADWDLMDEKWGFDTAIPGPRPDWNSTRDRSAGEKAFDLFRTATPPQVWIPAREVAAKAGWT